MKEKYLVGDAGPKSIESYLSTLSGCRWGRALANQAEVILQTRGS